MSYLQSLGSGFTGVGFATPAKRRRIDNLVNVSTIISQIKVSLLPEEQ